MSIQLTKAIMLKIISKIICITRMPISLQMLGILDYQLCLFLLTNIIYKAIKLKLQLKIIEVVLNTLRNLESDNDVNDDNDVALPCLALPCLALPCLALPCLALPCLALPCLALPLPCLALDTFEDVFMNICNKHVPIKLKYVRANDGPFMNKELRKEVMIKSNLKNICNRGKSDAFNLAYKKQRNKCTKSLKKSQKDF